MPTYLSRRYPPSREPRKGGGRGGTAGGRLCHGGLQAPLPCQIIRSAIHLQRVFSQGRKGVWTRSIAYLAPVKLPALADAHAGELVAVRLPPRALLIARLRRPSAR